MALPTVPAFMLEEWRSVASLQKCKITELK